MDAAKVLTPVAGEGKKREREREREMISLHEGYHIHRKCVWFCGML